MAGLCGATVVVEARCRSGALITADFALEEGREVFAVPGEITSALSEGTNALLRLGATPLLTADDVLLTYGIESAAPDVQPPPGAAGTVLGCVSEAPATLDDVVRVTGLDTGTAAAALTWLELDGRVAAEDGVYRALPR